MEAGLFSAAVATLVSGTSQLLSAPNLSSIGINSLFFSSLVISLITALLAMLVKQWARQYRSGLGDGIIPWRLARRRHERYSGLEDSPLREMVAWLPILMHLSLLIFTIGLAWWMKYLHTIVAFVVVTAVAGISLVAYVIFALDSSIRINSPFKWPPLYRRRRDQDKHGDSRIRITPLPFNSLIPTPMALPPSAKRQVMPPSIDVLDHEIILYLLERVESVHELEFALDTMRQFQSMGLWSIQSIDLDAAIILRSCQKLANSCFTIGTNGRCILEIGMRDRARRVCQFIEWFYNHISINQRQKLRQSPSLWPSPLVTQALAHDSASTRQLEDTLLATLTESKLYHANSLSHGGTSSCKCCWKRDRFNDLRNHLNVDDEFEVDKMQNLVTCAIIAD